MIHTRILSGDAVFWRMFFFALVLLPMSHAQAVAVYDASASVTVTLQSVTGNVSVGWFGSYLQSPDENVTGDATTEISYSCSRNGVTTDCSPGGPLNLGDTTTTTARSSGTAGGLTEGTANSQIGVLDVIAMQNSGTTPASVQLHYSATLAASGLADSPFMEQRGSALARYSARDDTGEIGSEFNLSDSGAPWLDPPLPTVPPSIRTYGGTWSFNLGAGEGERIDIRLYAWGQANGQPIPEPRTLALFGIGLAGILGFARITRMKA